ncbi:EAL domain-containing protein [Cyanobium sp. ATX 6E8]|uniref:EAL domain-containing protein n=1 Tax=Cyanobium sp. ATX 6E8 TaxID=2823701 RepID=UPI0020CC6166|nr:EAL domain-containing protein [Cyanobium sp. ATX 6E8]MCP9941683.1 EAL domain-containing protein [Cyanobium sp. ATX 6E8]
MATFHIQPIIDLASGRLCGGEVLWRPNNAQPTAADIQALDVDPDLNIAVTQDSFIVALRALDRMPPNLWLSVNLSCQFIGSGLMFFRPISRALGDLDSLRRRIGRRLVVEVTESGVADQHALSFIHELADLHTIAVDDFGTGDAPLSHMLNLHFSKLKLDRSIVAGVDVDGFRQRFVKWVVSGCHAIGVEVCAEGVETEAEASFLRNHGVNQGQGWLWSEALPVELFESLALAGEAVPASFDRLLNAP